MSNRQPKDPVVELTQLFGRFSDTLKADAKRFNEEQQKTKDKIANGAKLTKHRIAL